MKKLLALFIIGGLLSTITGCPPGTTTQTRKSGTTEKMEEKKTGGSSKMDGGSSKMDGGSSKMDDKKMDDKKSGTDKMDDKKSGGTKTEEKKEETKKK